MKSKRTAVEALDKVKPSFVTQRIPLLAMSVIHGELKIPSLAAF
jgi:hypothetical protein